MILKASKRNRSRLSDSEDEERTKNISVYTISDDDSEDFTKENRTEGSKLPIINKIKKEKEEDESDENKENAEVINTNKKVKIETSDDKIWTLKHKETDRHVMES